MIGGIKKLWGNQGIVNKALIVSFSLITIGIIILKLLGFLE